MALLRAHQFFNGVVATPPAAPLYTVPAGWTIILKDVSIQNVGASTATVRIVQSGRVLTLKSLTSSGSAGSSWDYQTWVVLTEGQALSISSSVNQSYNVVMSGSLLYN